MLGQFAWQNESDCSLDLPRGHGGLLVVPGQGCSLDCDLLENVSDERVQD